MLIRFSKGKMQEKGKKKSFSWVSLKKKSNYTKSTIRSTYNKQINTKINFAQAAIKNRRLKFSILTNKKPNVDNEN